MALRDRLGKTTKPVPADIDFVIPWVDGSDPAWQAVHDQFATADDELDYGKSAPIRFRSWDNLQYWFRGVEKFAPWVRKIHFVTWGHLPPWMNTNHPKLHIVRHEDYIPSKYLPTFSSHVIEWNFHRIEGIAEQFVYFNDDMFVLRDVKPTDFFIGGKPCDCAAFNAISLPSTSTMAPSIYNTAVINKYFTKRDLITKHFSKWFNPKYGSEVLRTLCLLPWPRITGMMEPHLPTSLLKSTYETLWSIEPELLDRVSSHKFRDPQDVSQWLLRDWQIASGNFAPRSPKVGKRFIKSIDDEIVDFIVGQKAKLVCVNDDATEESFEEEKLRLQEAFATILPERSSFEIS